MDLNRPEPYLKGLTYLKKQRMLLAKAGGVIAFPYTATAKPDCSGFAVLKSSE
ncbi:hypothetical protein [Rufibacter latericius]|uniref:hypothetical protein n=1 Tax=Rufibacter latericius TaxID=2487040 RepID=UPI0014026C45|nr:hypothetical protein [Rufibacter latericius]